MTDNQFTLNIGTPLTISISDQSVDDGSPLSKLTATSKGYFAELNRSFADLLLKTNRENKALRKALVRANRQLTSWKKQYDQGLYGKDQGGPVPVPGEEKK